MIGKIKVLSISRRDEKKNTTSNSNLAILTILCLASFKTHMERDCLGFFWLPPWARTCTPVMRTKQRDWTQISFLQGCAFHNDQWRRPKALYRLSNLVVQKDLKVEQLKLLSADAFSLAKKRGEMGATEASFFNIPSHLSLFEAANSCILSSPCSLSFMSWTRKSRGTVVAEICVTFLGRRDASQCVAHFVSTEGLRSGWGSERELSLLPLEQR